MVAALRRVATWGCERVRTESHVKVWRSIGRSKSKSREREDENELGTGESDVT